MPGLKIESKIEKLLRNIRTITGVVISLVMVSGAVAQPRVPLQLARTRLSLLCSVNSIPPPATKSTLLTSPCVPRSLTRVKMLKN
jgi:hypothetical protein